MTEEQMYLRCINIEAIVKDMVLHGTIDNETLVKAIDIMYPPDTPEEMEAYSEAIIYARCSILN